MPDWAEQAIIVEPVDPAQCCHSHAAYDQQGSPPPDHLSLVETINHLCQCVVTAVAYNARRRNDVRLCLALSVVHGMLFTASIALVSQTILDTGPARMDAWSNGSSTKPTVVDVLAFQPTMRRV